MIVYRGGRADCMLVGRLEQVRLKFKTGYEPLPAGSPSFIFLAGRVYQ
jgi:hypothetical protein